MQLLQAFTHATEQYAFLLVYDMDMGLDVDPAEYFNRMEQALEKYYEQWIKNTGPRSASQVLKPLQLQ